MHARAYSSPREAYIYALTATLLLLVFLTYPLQVVFCWYMIGELPRCNNSIHRLCRVSCVKIMVSEANNIATDLQSAAAVGFTLQQLLSHSKRVDASGMAALYSSVPHLWVICTFIQASNSGKRCVRHPDRSQLLKEACPSLRREKLDDTAQTKMETELKHFLALRLGKLRTLEAIFDPFCL